MVAAGEARFSADLPIPEDLEAVLAALPSGEGGYETGTGQVEGRLSPPVLRELLNCGQVVLDVYVDRVEKVHVHDDQDGVYLYLGPEELRKVERALTRLLDQRPAG